MARETGKASRGSAREVIRLERYSRSTPSRRHGSKATAYGGGRLACKVCRPGFSGSHSKPDGKLCSSTSKSNIVLPLISESPRTTHNKIPFPKLEKILVDILVDENIFFGFQGAELSTIYENAFNTYWLNQRTMFRYARRRNAGKTVQEYIQTKTGIQLETKRKSGQ